VITMTKLERWTPYALAALRIIAALLFVEHGLMKLFHFPAPQPGAPDQLPAFLVVAAWLEIMAGGLLAAGLLSRPAAFLCSGEMAVAYFTIHAPRNFWPGINDGEGAILFCFVFLLLAVSGPGALSLDAVLGRRSPARPAE
jgi:putative oxidoreductase